jgi:uncharacterized protein (TIGR02118 family)
MIKVSVFYPNGEGKNFNMDYYCNEHMHMVKQKLGAKLKGVAADKGVSGPQAGGGPSYLAVGHLYFDSVEDFQAVFAPHVAAFTADLPNFTNSAPEVHIFEVGLK